MKKCVWMGGVLLGTFLWSCDRNEDVQPVQTVDSDFEQGADGWEAGFADYGADQELPIFEFDAEVAALPAPLDASRKAFMIQSHNRSDDVFMFLKKKVSGLDPDRTYKVSYAIDLATNAAQGSVGIGGSPAESVYLKAGASPDEPVVKLVNNYYEVTVDKGQQAQGGTEMVVVGNMSNGTDEFEYRLVQHSNTEDPVSVKPNADGEIWLCVGTDSGFEGLTRLYYDRIRATIRE